jgi:hypothetical protein
MMAPLAWVNLYGVNAPIKAPRLMSEVLWLGQTLADLQLLMYSQVRGLGMPSESWPARGKLGS